MLPGCKLIWISGGLHTIVQLNFSFENFRDLIDLMHDRNFQSDFKLKDLYFFMLTIILAPSKSDVYAINNLSRLYFFIFTICSLSEFGVKNFFSFS